MGNSRNTSSHNSDSSSHLKIGLEFGQKIYFEDVGIGVPPKSAGGSSAVSGVPPKKGRTGGCGVGVQSGGGGQQPPRCQVEGCNLDLSEAKTYYSRHKVCGMHSKTATVIVGGLEQRFCQQCSRFHLLPEFDQGKRSCRRRLAGHNERHRKPPPGSLFSPRYGCPSSTFLENNKSRSGGFLMDFSTCPKPNERGPWQSSLDDNPPPDLFQSSANRSPYPNHSALSLLSNQLSDSSKQPLSLGQNYYMNPDAATDGGSMDHFSWGFKCNEASSCSSAHLGLRHLSQPDSGHYSSNELELAQQSGRQYMEVEHIL